MAFALHPPLTSGSYRHTLIVDFLMQEGRLRPYARPQLAAPPADPRFPDLPLSQRLLCRPHILHPHQVCDSPWCSSRTGEVTAFCLRLAWPKVCDMHVFLSVLASLKPKILLQLPRQRCIHIQRDHRKSMAGWDHPA